MSDLPDLFGPESSRAAFAIVRTSSYLLYMKHAFITLQSSKISPAEYAEGLHSLQVCPETLLCILRRPQNLCVHRSDSPQFYRSWSVLYVSMQANPSILKVRPGVYEKRHSKCSTAVVNHSRLDQASMKSHASLSLILPSVAPHSAVQLLSSFCSDLTFDASKALLKIT